MDSGCGRQVEKEKLNLFAGHGGTNAYQAGFNNGEPFTAADAVAAMVKFRDSVQPNQEWVGEYQKELKQFAERVK